MKNSEIKVALITGGTKGIGFGIAEALLEEGIHVAITGRNKSKVSEAAEKLNSSVTTKVKAIGLMGDVTDFKSIQKAVDDTIKQFGQLDIVVANAGLGHFAPIEDLTIDQCQETIDTNLTGSFYTIQATIAALKTSRGYFITISRLAGTNFFSNGSAYHAS